MIKPKKRIKRNNFTLTDEAQKLIDKVDKGAKSYIVSQAIVTFMDKPKECEHLWTVYTAGIMRQSICSKCGEKTNPYKL